MNNDETNDACPKKIGEYLKCDDETITAGLEAQRDLESKGSRKLFGEVLLDLKRTNPEKLSEALYHQRVDRLKLSPLFFDLKTHEIDEISDLIYEKSIAKDALIIEQDTLGESFFVLITGKLKVFRRGDYDEIITLGTVGHGECIGEMGFFSDGRRSASVIALEPSSLIEIKYFDLESASERLERCLDFRA